MKHNANNALNITKLCLNNFIACILDLCSYMDMNMIFLNPSINITAFRGKINLKTDIVIIFYWSYENNINIVTR